MSGNTLARRWSAAIGAAGVILAACASGGGGSGDSVEPRSPSATSGASADRRAPAEGTLGLEGRTAGRGYAYPGFVEEGFATEPVALLPPAGVALPPDLEGGPEGEALRRELQGILIDRLPAEIRILHTAAPVFAFHEWAGADEAGPRAGYLQSILGWSGTPGPAGELPPLVGDSVEELGDRRGIRYFLFPRALTVARRDPFHYAAALEAYVLDARGERVVWAGEGTAEGRLAEGSPESLVAGVVRDSALRAAADLAARLPGRVRPGGNEAWSDVETGAGQEGR